MKEQKNCKNCEWCELDPMGDICVNDESEYCAEWVWQDTVCDYWEERKE